MTNRLPSFSSGLKFEKSLKDVFPFLMEIDCPFCSCGWFLDVCSVSLSHKGRIFDCEFTTLLWVYS